jgi:Na+-transporting NADH:ubiquinone oxidoreductase subunit NqrC
MTVALIACVVLVAAGFIWLMDRKDRRAHEERQADRLERANLMQRIQAPERAVVQHEIAAQAVEHVQPPQSDEEFWKWSEEHAAAVAELEARENAMFER